MSSGRAVFALLVCAGAGWLVPALVVAGLAREMVARGALVGNYRGRRVFLGLGVAWLAAAALVLAAAAAPPWWVPLSFAGWVLGESGLAAAAPLVIGAFALGLLDDAYGSGRDRGLRGHLRALREGRLTTGLLKAAGIVLLALLTALVPASGGGSVPLEKALHPFFARSVLLYGAAIALTANLVNLLDLRPARALKAQVLLGAPSAVVLGARAAEAFTVGSATAPGWLGAACLLAFVLGPVAAVWAYDAGERGMLGDAGSNAGGALVGVMAATALPRSWLPAWVLLLLGLNLLSERVSFSALIERNPALRWLDGLGRAGAGPPSAPAE